MDAMRDAERVVSAYKRLVPRGPGKAPFVPRATGTGKSDGPTPMDIGNLQIKKLTPEERDQCRKKDDASDAAKRVTLP